MNSTKRMGRVDYGYVSAEQKNTSSRSCQEKSAKRRKLRKTRKSAGGVVICDETKQAAESIR